jgi:hypothetical protein
MCTIKKVFIDWSYKMIPRAAIIRDHINTYDKLINHTFYVQIKQENNTFLKMCFKYLLYNYWRQSKAK